MAKAAQPEKHEVWFLWGTEACNKYNSEGNVEEHDLTHHEYATKAELDAFIEGVEAAEGWMESQQFDEKPVSSSNEEDSFKEEDE